MWVVGDNIGNIPFTVVQGLIRIAVLSCPTFFVNDNFFRKFSPIFHTSSITICSLIGNILEKLIYQIPIGPMHFYTVDAGFVDRI